MAAQDQGFRAYGAKLQTPKGPYNPYARIGDPDDPARYVQEPGVNFMRPWIAIRNGPAFQWPLGMEGVSLAIDPTLGIHKPIGGNTADVDVIHSGEEHITLNGSFPGDSAPDLVAALRDIVYQGAGREGKLLWLPELVTYVQRVEVVHFESSRAEEDRGRDMRYSIELVRLGIAKTKFDPPTTPATPQPVRPAKGKTSRTVKVDAKHNTLRKIAAWKLKSADKWRTVYNANSKWFVSHKIPLAKAPDYRLPLGTTIHY